MMVSAVYPATSAGPTPVTQSPSRGLRPAQLAVIINTADPLSVAIGAYYTSRRHIPKTNVVKVRFDYQRDDLPASEFTTLETAIERQLNPRVQAYALTWVRPYRVGCMSITSAFAFGVHDEFCASSCLLTRKDPYFDAWGKMPYSDLRVRPAMSIAALDFAHAKALIDRGVSSDGLAPRGTAYLVTTTDAQRNVRATEYPLGERVAGREFNFQVVAGAAPENPSDVMFYFTGSEAVQGIERIHLLPGAVADHLTSFGGMLTDSPQMSSLRWLDVGATGSYGTVVEPCNFVGKFPNVAVLMAHYLAGDTLIEAYWKSVQMPGQGLFIGEPLAAPFRTP
jgi:uncharacterized protein (TIGR03790 family)